MKILCHLTAHTILREQYFHIEFQIDFLFIYLLKTMKYSNPIVLNYYNTIHSFLFTYRDQTLF